MLSIYIYGMIVSLLIYVIDLYIRSKYKKFIYDYGIYFFVAITTMVAWPVILPIYFYYLGKAWYTK